MRILVLIHEFPPIGGGGGRVAQDLCQGFAESGHDVRILTVDLDGVQDEQRDFGFEVRRIASGRREAFRADLRAMGGYVLAGFWAARKEIRDWVPDVIHVHFAVPAGPIAWMLSKLYRIPYVLTAHLGDVPGGVPDKTNRWFRWVFPFTPPIWKAASRVVAVSEYTRQLALAYYSVEIDVIQNGVDTGKIAPLRLVSNQIPRIVFAGRLMEQKNPCQVVRVLAGLKDLPWSCVMFGDGPLMPAVAALVRQYQLDDRITLGGWVDPETVLTEFARSEILFMPSRSEGLPIVGVQALASGLAIVVGNIGGFREVVQPGVNGYIFDPDDVEGMQQGLSQLLLNPDLLWDMRQKSLAYAKKFELSDIINRYEQVFEEITRA